MPMITARSRQFAEFLVQGEAVVAILTPREEKVARMLAEGKTYDQIGEEFAVTKHRVKQIADKAQRKIKGRERDTQRKIEYDRYIEECKGKPLEEIPVSKLFSVRLMNALYNAKIRTAADLVKKRFDLGRARGLGSKFFEEIDEVLRRLSQEDTLKEVAQLVEECGGEPERKVTVEQRLRKDFVPFYIVTEEGYSNNSACLSSFSLSAERRLNGTDGMRLVTLEEIEDEYGAVEAQAFKLDAVRWPESEWSEQIFAMIIWTETSIVIIGSNERWEWLQNFPRHPAGYDNW
ncbi:MAG: hypothetical protein EXS69_02490 [Candidatus Zambryskibacteria bacterium]|nr:hypothetical protein [Candidatus Zambryskibacteria bacterium]